MSRVPEEMVRRHDDTLFRVVREVQGEGEADLCIV
jgi:hypothetical protein